MPEQFKAINQPIFREDIKIHSRSFLKFNTKAMQKKLHGCFFNLTSDIAKNMQKECNKVNS